MYTFDSYLFYPNVGGKALAGMRCVGCGAMRGQVLRE